MGMNVPEDKLHRNPNMGIENGFRKNNPVISDRIRKMGADAKRAKRNFRDCAEIILDERVNIPEDIKTASELLPLLQKHIRADGQFRTVTLTQGITLAIAKKALKGDINAACFLRDVAGQAPVKEVKAHLHGCGFTLAWPELREEASKLYDEYQEYKSKMLDLSVSIEEDGQQKQP